MNIYWITNAGIEDHQAEELDDLLTRTDGIVWVDVPADEVDVTMFAKIFRFHPLALRDCHERSLLPKVHAYADHVFLILHTPEPGIRGHVHLLELDLFISRQYVVTVHGPLGVGVPMETAMRETHAVYERIAAGRLHPTSPFELAYAIVSTQTRYMESMVSDLARKIAIFERQIMQGQLDNMHTTLEEVFLLRHELLTIRTIGSQSGEVVTRMATLAPRVLPVEGHRLIEDLVDQFNRIRSLCAGEMDFLQGVIDYYQIRTTTKMNLAMERLTLMSALLLPITAIASLYGMNIIVFEQTNWVQLMVVGALIALMMTVLVQWSKRQGWW